MRKFLLLLTVAVAALQLTAAPVDQATAQRKAKSFLTNELYAGKMMAPAALNPVLLKAEYGDVKVSEPVYYIFNTSTTFIVVAGDDRAEEILMIGDRPLKDINNLAPGLQDMLSKYKDEMMFLQEHPGLKVDPVVKVANTDLRANTYGPLLTCNWDQTAPYWNQCKFTYSGTSYQCYTGCPATSASMVMYYWKYPTAETGTVPSYTSTLDISQYNSVSYTYESLPSTTFDWNNMRDNYTGSYPTAAGTAVATLMRYVGQAEKMMYGTANAGGSGISSDNASDIVSMFKFFGYKPGTVSLKKLTNSYYSTSQNYTDAQWLAMISEEMAAGRPIVYMAIDPNNGGHAFNVDGYRDSDSKCHVNFGWSGDGNAWCTLHSFGYSSYGVNYKFNKYEQMVIGIEPPEGGVLHPEMTVTPTSLSFSTGTGGTVTKTFTVSGNDLSNNITLTLSGSNYFSISSTTVTPAEAMTGKTITVTYKPVFSGTHTGTVTVSCPGVETQTVSLSGTAATIPSISANPSSLSFSTSAGTPVTQSFVVTGSNLTGNISLSCSGEGFSIDKSLILKNAAANGVTVVATYNPTAAGNHSGTVTITSSGAETVTVSLTGTATGPVRTITADPTSLTFNALVGETQTKTFMVTGTNLTGNLALTLNNGANIYSITPTTITAAEAAAGKEVTVTYAPTAAGTRNATVTISGGDAASVNVSLSGTATEPVRTITATPTSLTFNNLVGETATQTFTVTGENLTGNLSLALNDANGVYSITPMNITVAEATAGKVVTVTYAPTTFGNHNAAVTISGGGANAVTVSLAGQASITKYAPVLLPANESYINLTQFRADWTDETPEANVSSYTLEVTPKVVEPVLLHSLSASAYTGNSYNAVTLPAPWGGTNVRAGHSEIYFRNNYNNDGSYGNITYTVPEGYSNATFTLMITSYNSSNGVGTLTVATPQTAAVTNTFAAGSTFYWVVTASSGEKITVTTSDSQYSPSISLMAVYSGDATPATLMATETGGADSRLITGITDLFYTVENLTAEGTFLYRVKSLYIDGTESAWSNIEEVTLFENAHPYEPGDVDHNREIDINDVTLLIDAVLGNAEVCPICGDLDLNGDIDIADVTKLIDKVLGVSNTFNMVNMAR